MKNTTIMSIQWNSTFISKSYCWEISVPLYLNISLCDIYFKDGSLLNQCSSYSSLFCCLHFFKYFFIKIIFNPFNFSQMSFCDVLIVLILPRFSICFWLFYDLFNIFAISNIVFPLWNNFISCLSFEAIFFLQHSNFYKFEIQKCQ